MAIKLLLGEDEIREGLDLYAKVNGYEMNSLRLDGAMRCMDSSEIFYFGDYDGKTLVSFATVSRLYYVLGADHVDNTIHHFNGVVVNPKYDKESSIQVMVTGIARLLTANGAKLDIRYNTVKSDPSKITLDNEQFSVLTNCSLFQEHFN